MSQQEIKSILGEMLLRYPRQDVPEPTQRAMAADLADIPAGELRMVCQRWWLTQKWWPSVAELRESWGDLDTANDENADLRWTERRMSRLGPGEQPNPYSSIVREPGDEEYPNPVCREAVKLFGWRNLYDTPSSKLAGEWAKHYKQARQLVITRKVTAPATTPAGDALPAPENVRPIKAVAS